MISKPPVISVVMITYGHEKYIEEAIRGVYLQETDFPVELIIANDCSPDRTDEVVRELIDSAPENIAVRYTRHANNKGMLSNFVWAVKQAEGKFIALCEGDDYWTDPQKLQEQVDFLQQHKGYTMHFHSAQVRSRIAGYEPVFSVGNLLQNRTYSGFEILNNWLVPTASVMIRSTVFDDETFARLMNRNYIYADIITFLSAAQKGDIYGSAEVMSVYNIISGSALAHDVKSSNIDRKYINHHLEMAKDFEGKYSRLNYSFISNHFIGLCKQQKNLAGRLKLLFFYNQYLLKSNKEQFLSLTNLKINIANLFRISTSNS